MHIEIQHMQNIPVQVDELHYRFFILSTIWWLTQNKSSFSEKREEKGLGRSNEEEEGWESYQEEEKYGNDFTLDHVCVGDKKSFHVLTTSFRIFYIKNYFVWCFIFLL